MKAKFENLIGFMIFIVIFLALLVPLMVYGAIITPIRYFIYVVAKVNDKDAKEYYF